MLNRTHQPPQRTMMRGRTAGRQAEAAASRALRLADDAIAALEDAPDGPHTTDGLAALRRAREALVEAQACADALRRGL